MSFLGYTKFEHLTLKLRSHRARQRARRASTHQIKLMLKTVSIHTDRVDRVVSSDNSLFRSIDSTQTLTLVLRFYFYGHVLRLGVKKPTGV